MIIQACCATFTVKNTPENPENFGRNPCNGGTTHSIIIHHIKHTAIALPDVHIITSGRMESLVFA